MLVVAALILVIGATVALLIPRYACGDGERLLRSEGPGATKAGWTCLRSDMGRPPSDRLPLKWAIGGTAALVSLVLMGTSRPRRD